MTTQPQLKPKITISSYGEKHIATWCDVYRGDWVGVAIVDGRWLFLCGGQVSAGHAWMQAAAYLDGRIGMPWWQFTGKVFN